ncbi:hypothetical protein MAPG_06166 [Magnaporthiopsis poae ATCC 64411]|uniref:Uncharacterized protein n=1 Tax=Magnaporthiopsis poae (strain ATCC 64411 / 73-15) TaxID=644358 RepID=A0A0C4E1B0_MAGP6|nr:hypothetical protein MAPG_06166 [Magnaporthiopsis poae ATCC 64411]
MHFSQVASTMLALGAGLASAVDVRLYYSNNCSGNYLICTNLGANVCCTGTSCDSSQKPDTLVLSDGTKFKVSDLDDVKLEQLYETFRAPSTNFTEA